MSVPLSQDADSTTLDNVLLYLVRRVQQRGLLGAVHVVHVGARVQQHLRKYISIRSRSGPVDVVKPTNRVSHRARQRVGRLRADYRDAMIEKGCTHRRVRSQHLVKSTLEIVPPMNGQD